MNLVSLETYFKSSVRKCKNLNFVKSRQDVDPFVVLGHIYTVTILFLSHSSGLLVLHFWAPWATQCEVMHTAMTELAKTNLQVTFAKVNYFCVN